jgi:sugar lactone lactonase YvrE
MTSHSVPTSVTVFRERRSILAESLVPDGDSLLWCDITTGELIRSRFGDPVDGSRDEVLELPAPLASLHPYEGGFIASLGDRVVVTDSRGQIIRTLATIDHRHSAMRLNEGKLDPVGRWVTGSMDLEGGEDGAFYSVTEAGGARVIAGGVSTGNGLEWSADGTRIYFTDTGTQTIYTGDYSADGEIGEVEVFHAGALHDGLVRDADGRFHSGIYGDGRVMHLSASGEEIGSTELPVPNVTSVTVVGSTLYAASARENLTEADLEKYPLSGSVFAIAL